MTSTSVLLLTVPLRVMVLVVVVIFVPPLSLANSLVLMAGPNPSTLLDCVDVSTWLVAGMAPTAGRCGVAATLIGPWACGCGGSALMADNGRQAANPINKKFVTDRMTLSPALNRASVAHPDRVKVVVLETSIL
jgi:hypothetical protein